MKQDKICSLLGIAMKSGNLVSGELPTLTAIRSGEAGLVVVAGDASDNTKKTFIDKCEYYDIPVIICLTKEQLGHAIGKEYRSSAAVLDPGLAGSVKKIYNERMEIYEGS